MQELALNELIKNGYTEDRASRRDFERRYRWLVIPGALLCFAPYPFTRFVWSPFSDSTTHSVALAVCFLLGFALCLGAARHASRSIPISRENGAPMQIFLRSDAPADTKEYLYVDSQSRTYFTRVISVPGT
ncbi:MAG: hypothetical protein QOF48_229 [Verrucomicrobiota bacterium]|jgi:hypothetical protein